MKIALLDAFPLLETSAEAEFIARFIVASRRLGIDACKVVTSEDIINAAPDLVIATHEFSAKLTAVPTIGILWSPLTFFHNDACRIKSIMSWDGYLTGSLELRRFAHDLQHRLPVKKPVSDGIFLPTNCGCDTETEERSEDAIFYIGTNWDRGRHQEILDGLAKADVIDFYGPIKSWAMHGKQYKGVIPCDGKAVAAKLAKYRVCLCLHKKEHILHDTPSMRIFEALSVGTLAIVDNIPFARKHLDGIAYFLEPDAPGGMLRQILDIRASIERSPEEAGRRAAAGRDWFRAHWTLEKKISELVLPLFDRVVREGAFAKCDGAYRMLGRITSRPCIEVVVRTGGRPISYLARAVASIIEADAEKLPLGIVVVDYCGRSDIEQLVGATQRHISIRYIRSEPTGFRSTALWDGIRSVKAEFLCLMDDDDTVSPNHYRLLHESLLRAGNVSAVYSGVIRVEDEPSQPSDVEARSLHFHEHFSLKQLVNLDNAIQSNCWMARSDLVKRVCGDDPMLIVQEDVYLYLLLAQAGPLAFSGSATAFWHWRSTSKENSMMSVDSGTWHLEGRRIIRRFTGATLFGGLYYADLLDLTFVDGEMATAPTGRPKVPLEVGSALVNGEELFDRLEMFGFHPIESSGIWTSTTRGAISFGVNTTEERLAIRVVFAVSVNQQGLPNRLTVRGGDTVLHDKEISTWDVQYATLHVPTKSIDGLATIVLAFETMYALAPRGDLRSLGFLLKELHVLETVHLPEAIS